MKEVRFDTYCSNYDEIHRESLGIAGRKKEYFAAQKVELLAALLAGRRGCRPVGFLENGALSPSPGHRPAGLRRIFEFGCGVGNNLPHLVRSFPGAEIAGCDVSAGSLEQAAKTAPGVLLNQVRAPADLATFATGKYDLILAANVFHHIDADERLIWMGALAGALSPTGVLACFEHNPWNPLTRRMVDRCPFDDGVELLSLREAKDLARRSGLSIQEARFTYPAPFWPAGARFAERLFGRLPFGFQYCLLARLEP